MRVIDREREISAQRELLWKIVADRHALPRWWPRVARVEDASEQAWTTVVTSPNGKALRADYTLLACEAPSRLCWRHEIVESPFERLLTSSIYELALEQAQAGTTRVRLRAELGLRGFARLGGFQVTRATTRQLDGALRGLAAISERPGD